MRLRSLATLITAVCIVLGVGAQARGEPFAFYPERTSFLAAVRDSISDDYSGYGSPADSSIQLSDAAMSAVMGETKYESTSFTDLNLVGSVYVHGDGTNYCAGCNGSFRLSFTNTSLTVAGGVFGVGVDILLHTSRHSAIGDIIPGDTSVEGTVLIEFKDGEIMPVTIPADVGFSGPQVYFLGLTDKRGIKSMTFGIEPLPQRHRWVIDNLTISARPRGRRP